MVGKLLAFWEGLFLQALWMWVLGTVPILNMVTMLNAEPPGQSPSFKNDMQWYGGVSTHFITTVLHIFQSRPAFNIGPVWCCFRWMLWPSPWYARVHTVGGTNPANHRGCKKNCKKWDELPIKWCRIASINSIIPISKINGFFRGP